MRGEYWDMGGLASVRRRPAKNKKPKLTPDQQRLVEKYLPMAKSWAAPFKRYWRWSPEDFESSAYVALVEAAVLFDPGRGIKFGSYARMRIKGALLDVQNSLRHTYQTDGSTSRRLFELTNDAEEGGIVMLATYDEDVGHHCDAQEFVEGCLDHLPPTHARACREIYIHGKTQKEAAKAVGCSKSKMSIIHKQAIDMLRDSWDTRVAGMDLRRDPRLD